jgi:hypothetical protein
MLVVNLMSTNRKEYARQYYLKNREKYLQRGKTEEALEKTRKRAQLKSLNLREENLKLNQQFIKDNGLVEHPDFPGYYGTIDGKVFSNKGRFNSLKELKPVLQKCNNGYYCLTLVVDKQKKQILFHRFISQIFIPNPNNYPEINHIDENKGNNNVENLEWCDRKYNANHSLSKHYIIENLKTGEKIVTTNLSKWCSEENISYQYAIHIANDKNKNKTLKNKTYKIYHNPK